MTSTITGVFRAPGTLDRAVHLLELDYGIARADVLIRQLDRTPTEETGSTLAVEMYGDELVEVEQAFLRCGAVHVAIAN